MLTTAASNALLKTLEEPPEHVVFVLATTEPEKVLPTIRSRTQHFDFHLLAGRRARRPRPPRHRRRRSSGSTKQRSNTSSGSVPGSARDTLSALDQVAATGGVSALGIPVEDIVDAVGARDAGAALVAVDASVRAGRDPRLLAEALIDSLRDAFLVAMGAPSGTMTDTATARAAEVAGALGPATLTRALELIGTASVDMRQAPDPRITLEVALVRLTRPGPAATTSPSWWPGSSSSSARSPTAWRPDLRPRDAGAPAERPAGIGPGGVLVGPAGRHGRSRRRTGAGAPTRPGPASPSATPRRRRRPIRRHRPRGRDPRSGRSSAPAPAAPSSPRRRRTTPGQRRRRCRDAPDAATGDRRRPRMRVRRCWPAARLGHLGARVERRPPVGRRAAPRPGTRACWPRCVRGPGRCSSPVASSRAMVGSCASPCPTRPTPTSAPAAATTSPPRCPSTSGAPSRSSWSPTTARPSPAAPTGSAAGARAEAGAAEEAVDLDDLRDAPDATVGGVARLKDAFPGAELLEDS